MYEARRIASSTNPEQAGWWSNCRNSQVDDLPRWACALRRRQRPGSGSIGGRQGCGGPADEEDHHQGRHHAEPGDQRIGEEIGVRHGADVRVLLPTSRGREEAGDG